MSVESFDRLSVAIENEIVQSNEEDVTFVLTVDAHYCNQTIYYKLVKENAVLRELLGISASCQVAYNGAMRELQSAERKSYLPTTVQSNRDDNTSTSIPALLVSKQYQKLTNREQSKMI